MRHASRPAQRADRGREAGTRKRSWLRSVGLGLVVALVALPLLGLAYVRLAPPQLLVLGSAFAAKTVCTNVNYAGRDAERTLLTDVQEQGHPLLHLIHAEVEEGGTTRASFPLGIASVSAAPRGRRGCQLHADGAISPPRGDAASGPAAGVDEGGAGDAGDPPSEALPVALDPAIQAILADTALTGPGFRAAIVWRDGRIVGERYGEGFDASTRLIGWSMAKTVTAALVGAAIEDGLMALDDDALVPEWSDGRRTIRLVDLLAMQGGLEWNEDYGDLSDVTRMLYLEPDAARFVMDKPLEAAPGTVFEYSTGTSVLLARLLGEAVEAGGGSRSAFAREALFGPLGMASAFFEADAAGNDLGGSLLWATPRDFIGFARFLLDGGRAPDGRRLVPEGYAQWMMQPTQASDGVYANGQMWRVGPGGERAGLPADTVWMRGHDGQSIALVPSKGLAVLRMGMTPVETGYRPQPLVRAVLGTGAS